ncbi:hypothetical protein V6N12_021432 [Hibiscus sabdariffa]|uniref:Secreted protein n=1 Tax=Hibiscus sabdariffa TaxID=183260 RepID=A0ABR2FRV0_9ROSI
MPTAKSTDSVAWILIRTVCFFLVNSIAECWKPPSTEVLPLLKQTLALISGEYIPIIPVLMQTSQHNRQKQENI